MSRTVNAKDRQRTEPPSIQSGERELLFGTILNLARSICRADAHAIWEWSPNDNEWQAVAKAGLSADLREIQEFPGEGAGQVRHVEDIHHDPRFRDRLDDYAANDIRSLMTVPISAPGERSLFITYYYRQPHPFDPHEAEAARGLADLASRAVNASRLNQEQQELRAQAERAECRASFLAEASKLLASSLDYETTLKHLAQLAVPRLADWCAVDLVEENGCRRQVAVAPAAPHPTQRACSTPATSQDPPGAEGPAKVIRTGASELYPAISDELLASIVTDADCLARLRGAGPPSGVIVPIKTKEVVLGTLTLICSDASPRFDSTALEVAEDLGRRAAVAIENSRLLREQQVVMRAMEQSEARLRRLVEANIIGVQLGNASGKVNFANDAFLRITGYTADDLAAGRINWLSILSAPGPSTEDQPVSTEHPEAGTHPYEAELIQKDGRRVPVLVASTSFEEDSQERVAFVLDLSERRQLEFAAHRLAAIVASSDDGIVSKDLNGIVTSWNAGAERIFGYTEEEMVGQPIAILVPADRPNEEPEILRRLRRGERVDHFETERIRKDGRRINVSVTISPVRDSQGRIVGASKIARDITSQILLRKELQERVEALALADRRKDEFLAMLAHELRNPLSPLTMAARIIRSQAADNPVLLRQQAVIERRVRHMARLLDDLLDVSRITRGKVKLRLEEVDLNEVVASAVDACRTSVDARSHSLAVILPDAPVPLVADPVRLEQVVSNLVLNAVKYTEPGGRLVVTVEADGGTAQVSVRDNGVGISPEFLPSVFDLFSQAEPGLDRSQGGLGMGLTLVKSLIELHGGSVEARSDGLGRGSEFVFRLPRPAHGPSFDQALAGRPASKSGRPLN